MICIKLCTFTLNSKSLICEWNPSWCCPVKIWSACKINHEEVPCGLVQHPGCSGLPPRRGVRWSGRPWGLQTQTCVEGIGRRKQAAPQVSRGQTACACIVIAGGVACCLSVSTPRSKQLEYVSQQCIGLAVLHGGDFSHGVNIGSDSISHAFHRTDSKDPDDDVLDGWILATKTPSMHHPQRQNVATSMVGLKNGHMRKNLTQMVNPRDIAGTWKMKKNCLETTIPVGWVKNTIN